MYLGWKRCRLLGQQNGTYASIHCSVPYYWGSDRSIMMWFDITTGSFETNASTIQILVHMLTVDLQNFSLHRQIGHQCIMTSEAEEHNPPFQLNECVLTSHWWKFTTVTVLHTSVDKYWKTCQQSRLVMSNTLPDPRERIQCIHFPHLLKLWQELPLAHSVLRLSSSVSLMLPPLRMLLECSFWQYCSGDLHFHPPHHSVHWSLAPQRW